MQQNTTEWLEFRSTKIGASDCPIIMQSSPREWGTPLELWKMKMGLKEPKPVNPAMQRGKDLEHLALRMFNDALDSDFCPYVAINPEEKWQIASLDGVNSSGSIVEIKCLGERGWDEAIHGVIPEYYQWQMQHQMCVTGAKYVFYVVYFDGKIHWRRYERDQNKIDILMDRERKFYECMRTGEAPEPSPQDYRDYRHDPHFFYLEDQLCRVLKQIDALKEKENDLRMQMEEYTKGENSKGTLITFTRTQVKGTVDYSKVPELKEVDLNAYRKAPYFKTTIRRHK